MVDDGGGGRGGVYRRQWRTEDGWGGLRWMDDWRADGFGLGY